MNNYSKEFSAEAVLKAWIPFRDAIGITVVQTAEDYEKAMAIINSLLDIVGNDENHPYAELLYYVTNLVEPYEEEHFPIPLAKPKDVLRFLMDQHNLDQSSFEDQIPQSRISEILSGRRGISKKIAKILSERFKMPLEVFLDT